MEKQITEIAEELKKTREQLKEIDKSIILVAVILTAFWCIAVYTLTRLGL